MTPEIGDLVRVIRVFGSQYSKRFLIITDGHRSPGWHSTKSLDGSPELGFRTDELVVVLKHFDLLSKDLRLECTES